MHLHRLLALTAFMIPRASFAAPVWIGDMETGDLSQWSGLLNGDVNGMAYAQVTGDEASEGVYAARIELHNDAVWPNGLKRVEVNHSPDPGRTAEGAALFFAWSFYLPATLPAEPSQQVGYWESNNSYQQMMAFEISGERISFSTRKPDNVVQWDQDGVATTGVWHRVAMRIAWSKDPGLGAVDVWFDGEQVVTAAAAQTLADDNDHFTQLGLLRGAIEFDDVPVILIDDAVEGDSLEDVHPEPVPPGGTTTDGETTAGGTSETGAGSTGAAEGSSGAPMTTTTTAPDPGGDETTTTSSMQPTTSGGTTAPDPGGGSSGGPADQDEAKGCGCAVGAPGGLVSLALLVLPRRRRGP